MIWRETMSELNEQVRTSPPCFGHVDEEKCTNRTSNTSELSPKHPFEMNA